MEDENLISEFKKNNAEILYDPYVDRVIRNLESGAMPLDLLLPVLKVLANQNKELWDAQRRLIKLTGKNMTNLERVTVDIQRVLEVSHEPMLNDVLEWLNDHCVSSNGSFRKREDFEVFRTVKTSKHGFPLWWDLSKPYLKDQSQELIDYLAGLI